MKKNLCAFIVLLVTVNYCKAQSGAGFEAGIVFSSYKAKAESVSITSKTRVGFAAGFTASVPMGKSFAFQPGLTFLQKGGTFKEDPVTDKTNLSYLELPLNFVYHTPESKNKGQFFCGAGPSLALGLSGKDKYDDGTFKETTDIKFGSGDNDDLKPFEVGANVIAGYQFSSGFFVKANYNFGLSNISTDSQSKYHNRYFGVRIGFLFGNRKK